MRISMNVSITPELERFVQDLLASGRYHSASEIFRDGLRLLEETERRRLLEKWLVEGLTANERARLPAEILETAQRMIEEKVRQGLEALAQGRVVDGEAFFAQWRKRLAGRAGAGGKNQRGKRAK